METVHCDELKSSRLPIEYNAVRLGYLNAVCLRKVDEENLHENRISLKREAQSSIDNVCSP